MAIEDITDTLGQNLVKGYRYNSLPLQLAPFSP